MNTVKIVYITLEGDNKEISLSPVARFYESYSFGKKNLTINVSGNVDDVALAALVNAKVTSITVTGEDVDDNTPGLNAVLTDYTKVRDIKKDYNFANATITLNLSFQKMLIDGEEDNMDEGEGAPAGV